MHSTTEELDEDTIGSQARATSWRKFAVEANGGAPPPGYYQNLLNKSHDGMVDVTSESSRVAKQVEKDLKRTFGIESLRGLRIPTAEAQKSLRNVLLAFAQHNPQVGYCQSMNFLAAVLLLVVDEEYALWCLTAIVEKLLPGHFSSCMAMALVDQGVLNHFLRAEDPELVAHLEELQVAPSLVTTQWLLTVFVGSSLPLPALLRLWDEFFLEAHVSFLFRAAAALLVSNRQDLLACSEAGEAYQSLSRLGGDVTDRAGVERLLRTVHSLQRADLLEPHSLAALRQARAAALKEEQEDDVADVAAAAVAIATQTAAQLLSEKHQGKPQEPVDSLASATLEWALVPETISSLSPDAPASSTADDSAEGWSLVERLPAPTSAAVAPGFSLSYVILQLEAPKLLESHFHCCEESDAPPAGGAPAGPGGTAEGQQRSEGSTTAVTERSRVVEQLKADLDALL